MSKKRVNEVRSGGGLPGLDPSTFKARFSSLRESKAMTQQDMAKELEVGLKTIQNWESGNIVPRQSRVDEIAKTLKCPLSYFYPVPRPVEAIRSLEDIFEREKDCQDVWILKTGRPFVSAENADLRQQMLDLMTRGVNFYFVCPGPECDGLDPRAYLSHRQFLAQIRGLREAPKYLEHAKLVTVPNKESADSLGLVDEWMSFVCAIYSDKGIRERGKVLDVWVEFALDTDRSPDGLKKEWFWVELSKNEAESWWARRCKKLNELASQSDPARPKPEQKAITSHAKHS